MEQKTAALNSDAALQHISNVVLFLKQHQDVYAEVVSRKREKTGSEVINFTTSNHNCKKS